MPEFRRIPDPGFAGDDGSGDPALRAALAAYAVDPTLHDDVLLALQAARLVVPVVAVLGEADVDQRGRRHDKTSDMATALLTGRDGRQALLAFTGLDTLAAWRDDARPVPVTAALAARSAVQEGAAALVVDIAGPTTYAVEGQALDALARGWTLVRTDAGLAWASAAVVEESSLVERGSSEGEPGEPGSSVVEPGEPGSSVVEPGEPGSSVVEPGEPGPSVVEPGEPGPSVVEPGSSVVEPGEPESSVVEPGEPESSVVEPGEPLGEPVSRPGDGA